MDSLNRSTCDGYSFINIPADDNSSLTDFNLDYSLFNSVHVDEPKKTETEQDSFSETLLDVNRSLLNELKIEQMKNLKLSESFVQLKREFEEFKSLPPADRKEALLEASSKIETKEGESKTLTTEYFDSTGGANGTTNPAANVSIKDEHLAELIDYLQTQLKFCKTEMYAMHSRMVDMVENFKSSKANTMETNTQTEVINPSCGTSSNNEETQTCDEDWENVAPQDLTNSQEPQTVGFQLLSHQELLPYEPSLIEARSRDVDSNEMQQIDSTQVQPTLYPSLRDNSNTRDTSAPTSLFNQQALKICPLCSICFDHETSDEAFVSHVNSHCDDDDDDHQRDGGRKCPLCHLRFDKETQEVFENHVHGHFGEGSLINALGTSSFYAHSNFE